MRPLRLKYLALGWLLLVHPCSVGGVCQQSSALLCAHPALAAPLPAARGCREAQPSCWQPGSVPYAAAWSCLLARAAVQKDLFCFCCRGIKGCCAKEGFVAGWEAEMPRSFLAPNPTSVVERVAAHASAWGLGPCRASAVCEGHNRPQCSLNGWPSASPIPAALSAAARPDESPH